MQVMKQDRIALDRASVRTFDNDGHMHVETANISKANVCPYKGSEIPNHEALGLDARKTYQLLRDPEELEKAAQSFNGKPVLFIHIPVNAQDHAFEEVVGAVSNCSFDDPYLKGSLSIWPGKAIKAIETGEQKELSSAYRYRADMTSGSYQGVRYDGVMRDISGNHVALVKEGRAGPDVVIGDSMPKSKITETFMATKTALSLKGAAAQGALVACLAPKLAQDAKIDLGPTLKGVTAANFKDKKAAIAADVHKLTVGKLAKDESIEVADIAKVLDAVAAMVPVAGEATEASGLDDDADAMDDDDSDLKAKLKAKGHSDEDIARICAGPSAAMDEDDDEKKKLADEVKAKDAEMKDMVKKPAMDAAIAQARKDAAADAIKTHREIRDAERAVRPWVGELAIAHDSAEGVYRTALTSLGVKDIADLPGKALSRILEAHPKPGEKPRRETPMAQDMAGAKSFNERFPDVARIGVL